MHSYYTRRSCLLFVHLRSAADTASANAVFAIACRDGVAKCATARIPIAHACRRVETLRFATDAVIASAAAVIVTSDKISDTLDNIARSVP